MKAIERIAIIGFGEVGGIFGADLVQGGRKVAMTDILLRDKGSAGSPAAAMLEKARKAGVTAHEFYKDAIAGADVVISAVTSSSSVDAATIASPLLDTDQIYVDINSVSPEKKREIARIIGKSKAKFVEAAVMAPVSPQRLKVPMLLGGSESQVAAEQLTTIGMNAKAISTAVGVASAIKMCRSVLVKGLEALAVECLFAARRYGAEKEVIASLEASYPSMGWGNSLPDYLVSRVAQHGRRRAAEMREVAEALRDVGIDPGMALATAARQDGLVDEMEKTGNAYDGKNFSWSELADELAAEAHENVPSKAESKHK